MLEGGIDIKVADALNHIGANKAGEYFKDLVYNLRRMVLLQGGGQWLGVRTIVVKPKSYVMIEYLEEKASKLLHIINTEKDKKVWLFNDNSYATDEALLFKNSYELYPGIMVKIMLEYKEGIYVYNPNDEEAVIKVDQYAMRTCDFLD